LSTANLRWMVGGSTGKIRERKGEKKKSPGAINTGGFVGGVYNDRRVGTLMS